MQRWQPRQPDGPDPMNRLSDAGPVTADDVIPQPLPRPKADPGLSASHPATAAQAHTGAAKAEPCWHTQAWWDIREVETPGQWQGRLTREISRTAEEVTRLEATQDPDQPAEPELRRARACHMLALVRANAAAERASQAAASWDKPLPGDPGFEAG